MQHMEVVHRIVVVRGREAGPVGRKVVVEEVAHMVLVGVGRELVNGRENHHSWVAQGIGAVGNRLVGAEERSSADLGIGFAGYSWADHHNLAGRRRNSRCLTCCLS